MKDVNLPNVHFQATVNVNNFMKDNKKLKRWSLVNLITGYLMMGLFVLLVILNRSPEAVAEEIIITDTDTVYANDLFNGVHEDELKTEVFYVDGHPVHHTTRVVRDNSVGIDRGLGVILDDDPDVIVIRDDVIDNVAVVRNPDHVVIHDRDNDIYVDNDRGVDIIGGNNYDRIHNRTGNGHRNHGTDLVGRHVSRDNDNIVLDDDIGIVDVGALDRAIRDRDDGIDSGLLDRRLRERDEKPEHGVDIDEDFGNLTLANDNDGADFDVDLDQLGNLGNGKGTGPGLKKGELYAYNFPSQGVGAGIGNGAVGAGAGGSAGIGAGIGEAVLEGQTVPTLGGIGTSSAIPLEGQAEGAPPTDGVGGLVSGAGTGGAAGLVTGTVAEKLGLGIGPGTGKGCAVHGGDCDGHHGHGKHADYEHLPKDGALYIMMHVDGSGSILNTRKQLDIMKDTLLKDALLPYYNNDESLYNRRVLIVDGSGERTLQFYTEAAEKDNVLAVVFQDEAQPVYHMPNFNRKPEGDYVDDLGKLKASLNGYGGVYRGIMFQVDRGRTFAKSFKEFVECSWRGEGYLKTANLKKYYWEHNQHHIKNKDGIVFSDVYHTKDSGDPQYYLDLIFEASKKVGLDLDIYGAGITDGKYNNKID